MTNAVTHDTRSRRNDVNKIGEALQEVLVDLVDLSLAGKHLHWNVEGPTFRSLHLELDELVDSWRAMSDEVAERASALGFPPDAQAATVARASRIDGFPAGRVTDRDVVLGLARRLEDVIERAADRDGVSGHHAPAGGRHRPGAATPWLRAQRDRISEGSRIDGDARHVEQAGQHWTTAASTALTRTRCRAPATSR